MTPDLPPGSVALPPYAGPDVPATPGPASPPTPAADPGSPTRAWSDVHPKVTAAMLAYAVALTVLSILADQHIRVSAGTAAAVEGLLPLLCAYLWPGR